MKKLILISTYFCLSLAQAATIAIIDTGFDLDHEFLKPKIFKSETDEEAIDPGLQKKFHGWNFHDNSHLKKPVIEDASSLQEILLFRNLRAKGHKEGLTPEEFEWFSNKNSDKVFMEKVKQFKKHAHGTFVAGIALREGENINIFPIRGLNIPVPVVAVEDGSTEVTPTSIAKTGEEKFKQEIKNSLDRISKKFSKICYYISLKKIQVVNASYGITYKNIITKFRETYRESTGQEIDEQKLQFHVNLFFEELYRRGIKTIQRYPRILFVFSAGNSGLDNDQFHHYPSRIKLPNTITVAAMNGEYLATFSNFGYRHVDVGAPGVAILSLVPRVYAPNGTDIYSPSSGTSMAAPYISNLAAQILNSNPRLSATDIKRIILETGQEKAYLKEKLISSSMVDNQRAMKAASLSREMGLPEAINLAKVNLIPFEDQINLSISPAISPDSFKEKILNSIPQAIQPREVDEDPSLDEKIPTSEASSLPKSPETMPQDKLGPPASTLQDDQPKSSDPAPANQIEEQSQKPSSDLPASSSQSESSLPEAQSPETSPSLPQ
jgi:subtilisin family serine protease